MDNMILQSFSAAALDIRTVKNTLTSECPIEITQCLLIGRYKRTVLYRKKYSQIKILTDFKKVLFRSTNINIIRELKDYPLNTFYTMKNSMSKTGIAN